MYVVMYTMMPIHFGWAYNCCVAKPPNTTPHFQHDPTSGRFPHVEPTGGFTFFAAMKQGAWNITKVNTSSFIPHGAQPWTMAHVSSIKIWSMKTGWWLNQPI